jgi:excisionase family DNA binding protein
MTKGKPTTSPDPGLDKQMQDYFTIKELSSYSRIGTKTLYELVNNREIEFVNIGRKIVIMRTDLRNGLTVTRSQLSR